MEYINRTGLTNKKAIGALCTALSMMFSHAANANYTCAGKVKGVAVEATTGHILVESLGPLSWPRFCSLQTEVNGIPVEVCKRLHATLLLAQTTQKNVTIWISDPGAINECRPLTAWEFVSGFYFVRLED